MVTHWPLRAGTRPFPVPDTVLHFLGFVVLGAVTGWMRGGRGIGAGTSAAMWYAFLLAYAAVDELTQPLAGRCCEWTDWLGDAAGAALGLILLTRSRG